MKTRTEWFNNLPADVAAKARANSTTEQLATLKNSLYDSLCDEDGFDFNHNGDNPDYWMQVASNVWEAENAAIKI